MFPDEGSKQEDENKPVSLETPSAESIWQVDPWGGLLKTVQDAMENLGPSLEEWSEEAQVNFRVLLTQSYCVKPDDSQADCRRMPKTVALSVVVIFFA
jgi:hypothetical protein